MRFLFIVILLLAIGGGAYVYAMVKSLRQKHVLNATQHLSEIKLTENMPITRLQKGLLKTMINSTVPPLVKSELEKANTNGTSYPEIWVRCLLASDEQLEEHVGKKLKLDSINRLTKPQYF